MHAFASDFICCTMKRKRTVFRHILKVADLPQELDAHRFYLQWYGIDACLVEQHRGILCFDAKAVRLATDQGVLCISGDSLELEALTDSRAKITGQLEAVRIEAKS